MKTLIIDPSYQPNLQLSHIDYFSRAMLFAQTNYNEELRKLSNIFFNKMAPTMFLTEYISVIAGDLVPAGHLNLFFHSFIMLNDFPTFEQTSAKLTAIDKEKQQAIYQTAKILNNGMILFGWTKYRDNFLGSPSKLQALPLIDAVKALQLGRQLGFMDCYLADPILIKMANHWHFETTNNLIYELANKFVLQHKIIGQILLYSAQTFGIDDI
jgi:hypothetical protein